MTVPDQNRTPPRAGDSPSFSVVTSSVVRDLLDGDRAGCVRVVREAYLAHDAGRTVNPNSHFLRFPDRPRCRIIALPAYIGQAGDVPGLAGIKWIASFPDNLRRGLPRASAVLVLNDDATGFPFACMEASLISAARTAASAALAAELCLGSRQCATVGFVGNGLISRSVHEVLIATGWTIDRVLLHDADAEAAERFRAQLSRASAHREVVIARDLEQLMRSSDLVVIATTATAPHIGDPGLLSSRPVVLHLSLRDLAPELLLDAHNVVDDIDHVMNADTSPHLAEKLTGGRDFVSGTIADLVLGRCRVARDRPIIVSPFGLGVLDLAVGRWLYERARAAGRVHEIDDFFAAVVG